MKHDSKILVTGHRGLVGSAVVRRLESQGYTNVLTVDEQGCRNPANAPTGSRFDFRNVAATEWLFSAHQPEYVFHCAAKVGGIKGNVENQSTFLLDNLAIQNNVIMGAERSGVKKFVFLGSSCIYPKAAPQPIHESALLTGPLEPTNEGYAIAKIAGVLLCKFLHAKGRDFVSAMPCNLFGANDKFDAHGGHVIPGMMARMHHAKTTGQQLFKVWGSASTFRELAYSDDAARALEFVMLHYSAPEPINIGSGFELQMSAIAHALAHTIGFTGELDIDASQPTGPSRKILDNSKLQSLGFVAQRTDFLSALSMTYAHFLSRR